MDTPQARHELAAAMIVLSESERGAEAIGLLEEALKILEPIRALAGANADLKELMVGAEEALQKARARR
ncbi:MAG: hypothetical protein QM820_59470 [Minicystis sp.]